MRSSAGLKEQGLELPHLVIGATARQSDSGAKQMATPRSCAFGEDLKKRRDELEAPPERPTQRTKLSFVPDRGRL